MKKNTKTEHETEKEWKVLIVDDDRFLLDMYSIKFREKGITVDVAFGSINALNKLKEGSTYDVILLDIVMPTMDGFEFLEEIKKKKLAEGAIVIILSNLGQPADIEKGTGLGADGYIVKANTTPSEVVEQVLEICKKKRHPSK